MRRAVGTTSYLTIRDLETLSRELGVTAAALSGWRGQFLEGGAANLKARERASGGNTEAPQSELA